MAAAGPVLAAVGVLNNLDSLAWMPWVWGAALAGSVPATAGFLALAYLAAEPALALVAGVVAFVLAPRRRTARRARARGCARRGAGGPLRGVGAGRQPGPEP